MRTGLTYAETYNAIKDEISKILEQLNCDYKILILNKNEIVLSDGVRLTGKNRRYFINLKSRPGSIYRYIWWFKLTTTDDDRNADILKCRINGCRAGGYTTQRLYGETLTQHLNTGQPWNKGKSGVQVVWNKGLTKETSESIRINFSEGRMGDKNPAYGKEYPEEAKKRQSETVKAKILSGEFTPNVKNSRTNWECICDGVKFRSSWEAAFWYANKHASYEKIRIPYIDESGKSRVYITDFSYNNVIYEIGPSCKIPSKQFKKIGTTNAGYELKFISEQDILEIILMFTEDDFKHFNEETTDKLKKFIKHETRKKNKN